MHWKNSTVKDVKKIFAELNIVFRDLKPENLMIDSEGHIVFVDFGFAIKLKSENDRTRTMCGSPGYFAPEVINNTGYGTKVDVWSLAILLCDLIGGYERYLLSYEFHYAE